MFRALNKDVNSVFGTSYEEKSKLFLKFLNLHFLPESNKDYNYTTVYAGEIQCKINHSYLIFA